ncbi:type VII secretion protein EssA [Streptococcus thoraltensis]|uniref:type VII secretion protein EssA n=1 Tax=Streptococcus TaxID=1301 RepID=UPI000377C833|nr:type VII secretion protein EssA [Streptococcus thoraltensis]
MKKSILLVVIVLIFSATTSVHSDGLKDNSLQFDSDRISKEEVLDTGFQPGHISELFKEDDQVKFLDYQKQLEVAQEKQRETLFTSNKMMSNQGEITKLFSEQSEQNFIMTEEQVQNNGMTPYQIIYIALMIVVLTVSTVVTYLLYHQMQEQELNE